MASGIVPNMFKIDLINPVYKLQGKDCRDPGSYRKIAILPALSKILEIAIRDAQWSWFKYTTFLPES